MGVHGPDHGADELGLQKLDPAQAATVVSGLAENCANELFTSTAVFATTPPRSSASRIAVSFTASATLSSVAIFQQRTGHRVGCFCQAALSFCTDLRCASTVLGIHVCTVDCGAFASVAVFLCALQRCARTSGFAFSHHASLHLTTGSGDDRSVKSEIVIFLFFQMWWTVFPRYTLPLLTESLASSSEIARTI